MRINPSTDALGQALTGLAQAQGRLLKATRALGSPESPDFPSAVVESMAAKHAQLAQIKVIQTVQEMDQHVLDILA